MNYTDDQLNQAVKDLFDPILLHRGFETILASTPAQKRIICKYVLELKAVPVVLRYVYSSDDVDYDDAVYSNWTGIMVNALIEYGGEYSQELIRQIVRHDGIWSVHSHCFHPTTCSFCCFSHSGLHVCS